MTRAKHNNQISRYNVALKIDLNLIYMHLPLRQEPEPLEPNVVFNWENPEIKKIMLNVIENHSRQTSLTIYN